MNEITILQISSSNVLLFPPMYSLTEKNLRATITPLKNRHLLGQWLCSWCQFCHLLLCGVFPIIHHFKGKCHSPMDTQQYRTRNSFKPWWHKPKGSTLLAFFSLSNFAHFWVSLLSHTKSITFSYSEWWQTQYGGVESDENKSHQDSYASQQAAPASSLPDQVLI